MAAPETYKLVVKDPRGKRHEAREARLDLDDRDDLREHLIRVARSVDSYLSGSSAGGEWLADWELLVFTEHEHSKGAYAGGWGEPAKVATFSR